MMNVDGSDTAPPITWRTDGGSGDGIDTASRNDAKGVGRSGLPVSRHRQDGRAEDTDSQGHPTDHRGIAPVDVCQGRHDTAGCTAAATLLDRDPAHGETLLEETLAGEVREANREVISDATARASPFTVTTDTPAQTTLTRYEFTQGC